MAVPDAVRLSVLYLLIKGYLVAHTSHYVAIRLVMLPLGHNPWECSIPEFCALETRCFLSSIVLR